MSVRPSAWDNSAPNRWSSVKFGFRVFLENLSRKFFALKSDKKNWYLWSYLAQLLYADDQILMATSEDELQIMAYHLNLIARKYKMTISSTKTKSMAMCGNHI